MRLAECCGTLSRIAILAVCMACLPAGFSAPGDLVREYTLPSSGTDNYGYPGYPLASNGTLIFVGAPEDDTQAANAGAVYVYDRNTTDPIRILYSPNPVADAQFGYSVAVTDDGKLAVGAPQDSTEATQSGMVYVFDAATDALLNTIPNPTPGDDDQFGAKVAAAGTKLLAGAPMDDSGTTDAGVAYLFDPSVTDPILLIPSPAPVDNQQFGGALAWMPGRIFAGPGNVWAFDDTTGTLLWASPARDPWGKPLKANTIAVVGNNVLAGHEGQFTMRTRSSYVYVLDPENGSVLGETHRDGYGGIWSWYGYAIVSNNQNPVIADPAMGFSTISVLDGGNGDTVQTISMDAYALASVGSDIAATNISGIVRLYEGFPPPAPPAAPTNLAAQAQQNGPVVLTWTDVSRETAYVIVRRSASEAFAVVGTVLTDATTHTDTSVISGVTYTYAVKAINWAGESALSNEATATATPPPSAPTNLTAQAPANSPVTLAWTDVANESGYTIYRHGPSEPFAVLSTVGQDVTTYVDSTVAPGVTYTYAVTAVSWAGESAMSNEATATVPPLPVQPAVLLNPDPASNARFGYSLSMDDRYIAVGCPGVYGQGSDGCVYVYDANTLAQVWKFTNPDNEPGRMFGWSVSVSNNRLAVGALHGERAYLFDLRRGNVVSHFDNPFVTPAVQFGNSVALSGANLAVGCFGTNSVLYLFNSQRGNLTRTLFDPSPNPASVFPQAVAMGGAYVAGSRTGGDNVYFFSRKTGAVASSIAGRAIAPLGSKFLVGAADRAYVVNPRDGSVSVTMFPPAPAPFGSQFGASVAASQQWAVVGDYTAANIAETAGSVYMYDARSGALLNTYINPAPQTGDQFGWSLGANRSKFAAGAPQDDTAGTDAGAVYVFPR